ncbi:MAG: hypothetical protein HC836_11240 [Richelia sp. RM2_1_2]|nr:hypothetical protein [Richelia sp. RM1_1_1]NJO58887.1 hypothetical protein [Richelia sp. RM2_1_2]
MVYSDEFGKWKQLGNINVTPVKSIIAIPPSSKKILRFTANINWEQWNNNFYGRSYALCVFKYGIGASNITRNFRYYPDKFPQIHEFNLIHQGNLIPNQIWISGVQFRYRSTYNLYNPLPFGLKIEEFINE